MSNNKKDKVVSPLITQKSRVQSVPNQSTNISPEDNINDGWITLNTQKGLNTPNQSPKVTKYFEMQN